MGPSTTPQVPVERLKGEDGFLQPPQGIPMELHGLPHGQSGHPECLPRQQAVRPVAALA